LNINYLSFSIRENFGKRKKQVKLKEFDSKPEWTCFSYCLYHLAVMPVIVSENDKKL